MGDEGCRGTPGREGRADASVPDQPTWIERDDMRFQRMGPPAVLLALLCATGGCEPRPEGWTPVLEETSTAFLETETERLLDHVRTARESLESDPAAAGAALADAQEVLEDLRSYYLPLFQARERAYNAYRSLYLDDGARVAEELEKIEAILDGMAEGTEGGPLQELQALGEALSDARLATETGSNEAAPALENLARKLNQAALKGDLILRR